MPGSGKPFQAGQSGNPAGRAKGARNRTTLALEAILEGEADAITRKAIELAKDGDPVALRMCMDRLMPVRKDRAVPFDLPKLETATDATKAMAALVEAVAAGDLTPSEAGDLSKLVADFGRVLETAEFADRLARIEGALPATNGRR